MQRWWDFSIFLSERGIFHSSQLLTEEIEQNLEGMYNVYISQTDSRRRGINIISKWLKWYFAIKISGAKIHTSHLMGQRCKFIARKDLIFNTTCITVPQPKNPSINWITKKNVPLWANCVKGKTKFGSRPRQKYRLTAFLQEGGE